MRGLCRAPVGTLALAAALPTVSAAQVFLASEPHPEFVVGPLFLIANVRPDRSVTVNLSFSLTLQPGVSSAALKQDLFVLWPAESSESTAPGPPDPAVARDLNEQFSRRGRRPAPAARPRPSVLHITFGWSVMIVPSWAGLPFGGPRRRGPRDRAPA